MFNVRICYLSYQKLFVLQLFTVSCMCSRPTSWKSVFKPKAPRCPDRHRDIAVLWVHTLRLCETRDFSASGKDLDPTLPETVLWTQLNSCLMTLQKRSVIIPEYIRASLWHWHWSLFTDTFEARRFFWWTTGPLHVWVFCWADCYYHWCTPWRYQDSSDGCGHRYWGTASRVYWCSWLCHQNTAQWRALRVLPRMHPSIFSHNWLVRMDSIFFNLWYSWECYHDNRPYVYLSFRNIVMFVSFEQLKHIAGSYVSAP